MTPKPVGYFLAPLLVFASAIAFGQEAYTPEKSQSDVTWIAWGIGIIVIAAVGFFLFKSSKNKATDAPRVSEPPTQQPKPLSFPSIQGDPRGSVFISRFHWESTSDSIWKMPSASVAC